MFEKGQLVRSRGGYPARALGQDNLCLRRTALGALLLDVIRQPDATVLHTQVPSEQDLEVFLASRQEAHRAARASARAPKSLSTTGRKGQDSGPVKREQKVW